MPQVSVLIPTYNRSNLVVQAIESVLKQTFQDFEIIVVDDGSTDDTAAVVGLIQDCRIKYHHRSHQGLPNELNFAKNIAQGKYIAQLDDDDLWPEDYLEKMVSALESNPDYGLAYALFKDFYPDGTVKDGFGKDRFISGWLTPHYFKRTPCILPSATVLRKSLCADIWQDETLQSYYADQDFLLRFSAVAQFLFVDNVCVKRRVSYNSLSRISLSYNAPLAFERFYKHLGGDKIIPGSVYNKKMSRHWRGLARRHYMQGNKKAAIELYKKALWHCPSDLKNIRCLIKAVLLSSKNDKMPGWRMPEPLPEYIKVGDEKIVKQNKNRISSSDNSF